MKKTQLAFVSGEMILTKETVKSKLNLTELEYNTILFEMGMTFIERVYPKSTDEYLLHSRNKMFWNWYQLQFHASAKSFLSRAACLRKVSNMKPQILVALFQNDMNFFCVHSMHIQKSFESYLNAYKRYGTRSCKAA